MFIKVIVNDDSRNIEKLYVINVQFKKFVVMNKQFKYRSIIYIYKIEMICLNIKIYKGNFFVFIVLKKFCSNILCFF